MQVGNLDETVKFCEPCKLMAKEKISWVFQNLDITLDKAGQSHDFEARTQQNFVNFLETKITCCALHE